MDGDATRNGKRGLDSFRLEMAGTPLRETRP
jgi:hypothetical protein